MVNDEHLINKLQLIDMDLDNMWFQQDGAT